MIDKELNGLTIWMVFISMNLDDYFSQFIQTSVKPVDFTSLIEKFQYWEGCENTSWSPVCIKTRNVQIFRPVLFLVWAVEGKTCLLLGAFIIG